MKTKIFNVLFCFYMIAGIVGCNKENNISGITATACSCIVDTLVGDWAWVKTYTTKQGIIENNFKSILKIFSQNEKEANYKIYVADTLFSQGKFKLEDKKHLEIELPHFNSSNANWSIQFEGTEGKSNKDTLRFFSGNPDDEMYYYQRIK